MIQSASAKKKGPTATIQQSSLQQQHKTHWRASPSLNLLGECIDGAPCSVVVWTGRAFRDTARHQTTGDYFSHDFVCCLFGVVCVFDPHFYVPAQLVAGSSPFCEQSSGQDGVTGVFPFPVPPVLEFIFISHRVQYSFHCSRRHDRRQVKSKSKAKTKRRKDKKKSDIFISPLASCR